VVWVNSLGFMATAFLGVGLASPEQVATGDFYEPPVETRHVRLKPDPLNPQAKREVSCFNYGQYVVKQVDLGEVGADRLSILPAEPAHKPPCRQEKEATEYVIPADPWSGYFEGVRSGYAFFSAADGTNGGLGFMVLRISDRKKVFEDTAEKGIESFTVADGVPQLRYQRVYQASCSLLTGGAACRDAVARETGVAAGSFSSCAHGYQAAKEEMAKGRCDAQQTRNAACFAKEMKVLDEQKWDDIPSVIVYAVAVGLGSAAPTVKRLGDASACRPSD